MSFLSHARFRTLTGPPGVRHSSFAAQPPDLLLRLYVYPLGFGLPGNLTRRLALYPVSVRRLAGFATPLPPPTPLLSLACGSLHLAVNTCGGTFTRKNCAMPGTPKQQEAPPHDGASCLYQRIFVALTASSLRSRAVFRKYRQISTATIAMSAK